MDRRTRQLYTRVLEQAVLFVYEGAIRVSVHSRQRQALRAIDRADAEATITSLDARVVARYTGHPEGVTYEITGRRANGDRINVVIAFDADDPRSASAMTIVTVMYPESEER